MRIVPATPSDAEALLALQRRAYAEEAARYDDWSIPPLTETLDALQQAFATTTILKAVDGDVIVGSVRGKDEPGICRVGRLIVEPERQRQGIGSQLLRAIERHFPDVRSFELFTGEQSAGNLRLYERHGYMAIERKALSPKVTIIVLRKPVMVS